MLLIYAKSLSYFKLEGTELLSRGLVPENDGENDWLCFSGMSDQVSYSQWARTPLAWAVILTFDMAVFDAEMEASSFFIKFIVISLFWYLC